MCAGDKQVLDVGECFVIAEDDRVSAGYGELFECAPVFSEGV